MHIPLRMCIACRRHKPKPELLRFGVDRASGLIVRRAASASDGRSVYICPAAECLGRAEKKRIMRRLLKAEESEGLYKIPED